MRDDTLRQQQLVGGVNMLLHPSTSAMFAAAGMLAADGRCKALDAAANGYARGEACVMLAVDMVSSTNAEGGRGRGTYGAGRGILIVVRLDGLGFNDNIYNRESMMSPSPSTCILSHAS